MFSTKEAKTFVESSDKFLSAGIVDNLDITDVKYEVSPNTKNNYITVTLAKNDATVNVTFWKPTIFGTETEEALKSKYLKVLYRLGQIVECYYPVGDPITECEVENFDQLANWFMNAINNRDKTKLVRAKLVYNKDGFLTLPNYAKYRFIEPMELPENWDKERVTLNDKDLLTRPVVADTVKSNANPFKTENVTQTAGVTFSTQDTTIDVPETKLPF